MHIENSKTVKANGDRTYDTSLSTEGKVSTERSESAVDLVLVAEELLATAHDENFMKKGGCEKTAPLATRQL
ncbi:MAG: hypothetical protein ACLSGX_09975 [Pseudoruminococcus massiliensis]|uniref:hypothetical protein n=1 Tax=Pseudoruminococcus massiliensis TaxID=2086583 RepID=UPI0039946BEB|nr:hypothetical protein [Oscillospiraceae bacterium]